MRRAKSDSHASWPPLSFGATAPPQNASGRPVQSARPATDVDDRVQLVAVDQDAAYAEVDVRQPAARDHPLDRPHAEAQVTRRLPDIEEALVGTEAGGFWSHCPPPWASVHAADLRPCARHVPAGGPARPAWEVDRARARGAVDGAHRRASITRSSSRRSRAAMASCWSPCTMPAAT